MRAKKSRFFDKCRCGNTKCVGTIQCQICFGEDKALFAHDIRGYRKFADTLDDQDKKLALFSAELAYGEATH